MKKVNGFMNIQLFAEQEGGQAQEQGATPPSTQQGVDYEKELNNLRIEVEKYKKLKDDYAKENADYKRKELDKMTDDEKKAKEFQDLIDSKNKMEAEIKTMKLEKELLSNGFTGEESEKLIKSNFAVKDIADIIKAKVEEAVKSTKAELLKGSTTTPPMGNGNANGNGESKFQEYQKSRQLNVNEVKL